jgi:hypothetical protein
MSEIDECIPIVSAFSVTLIAWDAMRQLFQASFQTIGVILINDQQRKSMM